MKLPIIIALVAAVVSGAIEARAEIPNPLIAPASTVVEMTKPAKPADRTKEALPLPPVPMAAPAPAAEKTPMLPPIPMPKGDVAQSSVDWSTCVISAVTTQAAVIRIGKKTLLVDHGVPFYFGGRNWRADIKGDGTVVITEPKSHDVVFAGGVESVTLDRTIRNVTETPDSAFAKKVMTVNGGGSSSSSSSSQPTTSNQ